MKRKAKSFVSVILSLMMIISMVSIGFITTNAATVDKSAVGAGAVNGVIKKGDTLYYDFSAAKPTRVNLIGDNWSWIDTGDIPADYIFKYTLTVDMDFNSPKNGTLCKCNTGDWTDLKPTVPGNGKNMVKVAADGKSYTWETFSGSELPTEPTTEPTTAPPLEHVAKWALNGGLSTDGWTTNFSAAKLVGTYEPSFAAGEVFSVSLELDSEKYFRLIKNGDYNQYKPKGSSDGNDHNLIKKGNNSQDTACDTTTGTEGAFLLDTGSYTLYVDQSGDNPKVWCTSGSDLPVGEITLKDSTSVNGSLSFKAEGKTDGTADVNDNVTIKAKPFAGFTLSGITVSYTGTDGTAVKSTLTEVTNNTASFTVPDVQADTDGKKTIKFSASFSLDKADYLSSKGEGFWIDVAPDQTDSTATLIKWNNYYGHNHNERTNPYTFYVPKNVDLSNAKIYNGYNETVTVNGTQITAKSFGTVNLSYSGESGTFTTSKANIKVMQGSTNAMFLYTTKKGTETALNTQTYKGWDEMNSGASKKDEKTDGGSCVTMFNDDTTTPKFSSAMSLDSVKGRGNSSWEASARRFGKYAYNMKLSDKTTLFDMAKDTKKGAGSKSWCLLANNADESMLRNSLAYKLADDTGLYSSPEFSFVDIYDNGEYLGQYLVTEKVDVGESKLVYGTSIEDINEDAGLIFDEDPKTGWINNNASFTADGKTYSYEYRYTRETTGAESPVISKATYLLEFEIEDRYMDEACWFTTPQGQHVVIKTPEFATEAQVKYIAEKFIAMEAKVFADAENAELSKHIDLDSFARMYLIQELSANLDAASTSYYVTYDCSKGDNARFVASPVWDYDWAFGQYKNKVKLDFDGKELDPKSTSDWYAKNKRYDNSEGDAKYSIQSKLANNSSFQQVIKKVWDGTDTQEGFYAKVQKYYGDNSQLDAWYNKISASVNMNETRWGFIKDDNVEDWGSADNSDTHLGAVNWLESSFLSPRASWMNGEFEKYPAYTQIAAPTLTATLADGNPIPADGVGVGATITLKAETSEIFVTYELYKDNVKIDSNTTGEFTVTPDSNGIFNYTVKTVYGSNEKSSNIVSVKVIAELTAELKGVTLKADKTNVAPGETITLTATPDPVDIADCTYTFYKSNGEVVAEASTSNTATVKLDTAGTYSYYVKASYNGKTLDSEEVAVTVEEPLTELTGVTLKADKTKVAPGTTIVLTATSTPANAKGYKYTFYHSDDETIGNADDKELATPSKEDVKILTTAPETVGYHYYYVVATCEGKEPVPSTIICVTAEEQQAVHTVRVWFKSSSAKVYVPSVSLDNGTFKEMTRIKQGQEGSTYFGATFSGSLKFFWYYADIQIDSRTTHTLTFRTAGTSVNATSEPNQFNAGEYYFAVDNLVKDNTLVNLPSGDQYEYIRNYHRSATHMVYNEVIDGSNSLGFTYVDGIERPMGGLMPRSENDIQAVALNSRMLKFNAPSIAAVGANDVTFTIESATLAQKIAAEIVNVSELQNCLLDVNLDAQVDIRDVTLMQKALAQ